MSSSSGHEMERNRLTMLSILDDEVFINPPSKVAEAWPARSGSPAQPAKELDDGL